MRLTQIASADSLTTLSRIGVLLAVALNLSACVTPIPVSDQAIDTSYVVERPVLLSVVDERPQIRDGKPANFIGRMHLAFGIPADIFVYPILSEDKKYKEQSLAAALEERIVKGLGDRGWSALGANLASRPLVGDLPVLIRDRNSDRFLLITLQNWFVSVNTNWVTAFNFDWAVRVEVFDRGGASILNYEDAGRDVVDVAYNESYGNHIRLAYKERLSKILEDARLRDALAN